VAWRSGSAEATGLTARDNIINGQQRRIGGQLDEGGGGRKAIADVRWKLIAIAELAGAEVEDWWGSAWGS